MKFLFFIPQLIYGGAEKVLVNFANDLVSRGHEVEVLELYEKGLLKPQFDLRVTFSAICSKEYTKKYYASLSDVKRNPLLLGKALFCKIVGYRRFAEKLAAKKYADIQYDIAINYLEIESPDFLLDHINAKKYLQWVHTDVSSQDVFESLEQYVSSWNRVDGIICVSQVAQKSFRAQYPFLTKKIHLLYNFFDKKAILDGAKEPIRLNGEHPILLSVGRMTEAKKYLRFLDILSRLKEEGFDFSWYVLGDGIQRVEIKNKIKQLGLEDRVFLQGIVDNPYNYMKECDLFVLPSGWEGFPTVTVEAKILNSAVLATDVSGIREQLIHRKTGWIVDNSESDIYEGLKFLLQNPEYIEEIRNNKGMEAICNNDEKYIKFMEICKAE